MCVYALLHLHQVHGGYLVGAKRNIRLISKKIHLPVPFAPDKFAISFNSSCCALAIYLFENC